MTSKLLNLHSSAILLIVLLFVTMDQAFGKTSHFEENNQLPINDNDSEMVTVPKAWLMELLQLLKLNEQPSDNYVFSRQIRMSNDIKRQSRYRQCYFNPVSCFK